MADDAQLSFGSWLRRGLAAGISQPDLALAGVPQVEVKLNLTFNGQNQTAEPRLTLVGPGEIAGLDTRVIVRTFPPADVNDAEAAFFVVLEVDQADLLWRYTPARASGESDPSEGAPDDKLRPWITLVVLEEAEVIGLKPATATQKLPVLTAPVDRLPGLNEAWAWAHTQARAQEGGPDPTRPGQVLGRLMSARILEPKKAYQAFLVPTFERGRLAGLGQSAGSTDALAPAWSGSGANVELPVYYSWRFQTGEVGSFQEVAARLGFMDEPDETVGLRKMDVSAPGLGFPRVVNSRTWLRMGGATRSAAAVTAEAGEDTELATDLNAFNTRLRQFLIDAQTQLGNRSEKLVVPPLYGRWYAAARELDQPPPAQPTNRPWFNTLNRHPRHRAAAGLGTQVIRREQQALMASAWNQVEKLMEINAEKRRLQSGRFTFKRSLLRQISTGSVSSQLTLTSGMHSQILDAALGLNAPTPAPTVFATLRTSPLPAGLFDPQWRRVSSPQGRLGKRLGLDQPSEASPLELFDELNSGRLRLAPRPPTPEGAITFGAAFGPLVPAGVPDAQLDALLALLGKLRLTFWGLLLFWVGRQLLSSLNGQCWWLGNKLLRTGLELIQFSSNIGRTFEQLAAKLRSDSIGGDEIANAPRTAAFVALETVPTPAQAGTLPTPEAPGVVVNNDNVEAGLFRNALTVLTNFRRRDLIPATPLKTASLSTLRQRILDGLQPDFSLPDSIKGRHGILEGFPWSNPDPLEPILAAPEFPQPMCLPLGDLSSEWILPGLSQLPANTVAALLPNRAFIEAYMVGLNHEMTRELLWQQYPVDQRNTYFRQFWDSRGFVGGNGDPNAQRGAEGLKDIKEVRLWGQTQLGANTSRVPPAEQLVLVIRGDIVRRYPNVTVFAAQGKPAQGANPRLPKNDVQLFPCFQGRLGSDVSYYGFDLSRDVARSDPGWFFVLQENGATIRFGVGHPEDRTGYAQPSDFKNADDVAASTAAQVAIRGFKPPVRVAIHASELIAPTS
jgi:hypothetical protein